jgi:hypothetical protein
MPAHLKIMFIGNQTFKSLTWFPLKREKKLLKKVFYLGLALQFKQKLISGGGMV